MNEQWRDIPGLQYYQISSRGRVRSVSREVRGLDGEVRKVKGKVLKQSRPGYLAIVHPKNGTRVKLILDALVNELFCGNG